MKAGTLNSRVRLQRLSGAVDELNQPIPDDWDDVATVWSNIRYLNGIETVRSNAPVSVARASIRIRRRPDIIAGMRVLFGSTVFNILAVLPDEESRERLDLACETGASANG